MQKLLSALLLLTLFACSPAEEIPEVEQWTTFEITLESKKAYDNPYTDVEIWAEFANADGDTLLRPGFWDGGNTWKIRFAPTDSSSLWKWQSVCSNEQDKGLHGASGQVQSVAYTGSNELTKNGLLTLSPGKRNVVHHSGEAFLVVGDTPWAIPFRATYEQVQLYAKDRQEKGFNTALLMSIQPDMKAEGPEARNTELGFARGFQDLHEGHITQLNPEYFQYLDSLIQILINHEIVPVYQPVFHGFGWKGLEVLGNLIVPAEYEHYCKYLLARYGSRPAMWLIAGDNGGNDPGVVEAGKMLEQWDCYEQPTGLHYNPCDDYVADWAVNNPLKHCLHLNKMHQSEPWLDFQWAQTGHSGEHLYHKVERMYDNQPTKASANGEPTYEGMGGGQNGLGWWQGEEAWMQLMSGGTMGVVYGAASLWQWKVSADEPGWTDWATQPKSWEGAMQMEGSTYVGLVGKILSGLDVTDIEKRWDLTSGQPLLAKEGELYIAYLNEGGNITISGDLSGLSYQWVNPKTGKSQGKQTISGPSTFTAPDKNPWVLIVDGMALSEVGRG